MFSSPHFETVQDWTATASLLTFTPRQPAFTAGFTLQSLVVHVMDYKNRRLPVGSRSLEAHYGGFCIDQKCTTSAAIARREALSRPYGTAAQTTHIAGHQGRSYPLGPEPDPDDPDGRTPAVVVWSDGPMFFLVASSQLEVELLLRIAESLYTQ